MVWYWDFFNFNFIICCCGVYKVEDIEDIWLKVGKEIKWKFESL